MRDGRHVAYGNRWCTVCHVVALRGDLLCHTGVAYAHVLIEQFVQPGNYHLCQHKRRVDATVRYHYACTEVSEIDRSRVGKPEGFHSGLLHAARGTPVMWNVVSVAELVNVYASTSLADCKYTVIYIRVLVKCFWSYGYASASHIL